jgi:hypothetical protein
MRISAPATFGPSWLVMFDVNVVEKLFIWPKGTPKKIGLFEPFGMRSCDQYNLWMYFNVVIYMTKIQSRNGIAMVMPLCVNVCYCGEAAILFQ